MTVKESTGTSFIASLIEGFFFPQKRHYKQPPSEVELHGVIFDDGDAEVLDAGSHGIVLDRLPIDRELHELITDDCNKRAKEHLAEE